VKTARRVWLLIAMVVGCVAPGVRQQPPQPDGLFSILLIFPAAILGRGWRRGASAKIPGTAHFDSSHFAGMRISCMAERDWPSFHSSSSRFTAFAGHSNLRHGQGRKRILIGTAVIGLVLFSVTDYFASLLSYDPRAVLESIAASRLRSLATAEQQLKPLKLPRDPLADLCNHGGT